MTNVRILHFCKTEVATTWDYYVCLLKGLKKENLCFDRGCRAVGL